MKTVLCDASPLIFLAKLDRLSLIRSILGEDVVVPQCVRDEVLSENAGPLEQARLEVFLSDARVVENLPPPMRTRSLSQCDRATLGWAIEHRPDWLLADERLFRRVAADAGVPVVGFLGLLVEAARRGRMTSAEVVKSVDAAVTVQGLRISVPLYRKVVSEVSDLGEPRA